MTALTTPDPRRRNPAEEKYQSIFENAVTGFFQTSPDGRYITANPALARIYGYESPQDLIDNISDIQHQLYVDPGSRREFSQQMSVSGTVSGFEARVRTRDGREIWITESARAVKNATGQIEYYEGTVKEITVQKQAEEALRVANELLEQRVAERTAALEKSNEELRRTLRENSTLAAAIHGAHFGVLISDPNLPDNPSIYVNPAFERISGYPSEEVLGKNCRFLQGPDTDAGQVNEMRQAIARRRPFTRLLKNYRKDGTPFWNDLAVNPVFNTQGELISFVGMQNDVTERVKAQQALEESQARYARICANAPGMVYQFALNGRGEIRFPFASEGCRAFCGLDPETIQEDPTALLRLIHRDDIAGFRASIRASSLTLEPWNWQGRFTHADGTERWMQASSRPERQPNGEILWDGFVMDVTQLYQAQVALRESEVRKAAILEAALDAIITTDDAGLIVEVNPATERIFGCPAAGLLGRNIAEFLVPSRLMGDPPRSPGSQGGLMGFLSGDSGQHLGKHLELCALRADGTEFPVELAISAIHTGGRKAFTGYLRDITERREHERKLRLAKEEAERANAAKSEFLSRMSHELRTPLNAILGFSQLLQRRPLDERQAESVGYISKAGRHLLGLVNEVLDLARIEAGATTVSLEPVEVSDIMQESIDLVRPSAEEHQVELKIETGAHFVTADRQRLKQVFVNLLSNGIKYNRPQGLVLVRCEVRPDECLAIHFEDTGPGIAPGDLPRLFAPFERLGADQGSVEGTGIGLAISHRLALLMAGQLTVTSDIGRGSTFTVCLPIALPAAPRAAKTGPAPREEHFAAAKTVLYIEDNPANLRLMEEVAREHAGVRLITGTAGAQAVELARLWKPELILLDLHLPDVPGSVVLQRLRAAPDLSHIPVVIISADVLSRQIERLREAGATDYLPKPIDVDQLLHIFDRHLAPQPLSSPCV